MPALGRELPVRYGWRADRPFSSLRNAIHLHRLAAGVVFDHDLEAIEPMDSLRFHLQKPVAAILCAQDMELAQP